MISQQAVERFFKENGLTLAGGVLLAGLTAAALSPGEEVDGAALVTPESRVPVFEQPVTESLTTWRPKRAALPETPKEDPAAPPEPSAEREAPRPIEEEDSVPLTQAAAEEARDLGNIKAFDNAGSIPMGGGGTLARTRPEPARAALVKGIIRAERPGRAPREFLASAAGLRMRDALGARPSARPGAAGRAPGVGAGVPISMVTGGGRPSGLDFVGGNAERAAAAGGGAPQAGFGAGGGGGALAGGAEELPQGAAPLTQDELKERADGILQVANAYYDGALAKAVEVEKRQASLLKTGVADAAVSMRYLQSALRSARTKYARSPDAVSLIDDSTRMLTEELQSRLSSASSGIESALSGMGSANKGCAAVTQSWGGTQWIWWGGWWPVGGGGSQTTSLASSVETAAKGHKSLQAAVDAARNVGSFAAAAAAMAPEEYASVADIMASSSDPAVRGLSPGFRSLGSEVSRRLSEIAGYLPKGLMPASAADAAALGGAASAGLQKVRALADGVKAEHLRYPMAQASDDLVSELVSAENYAFLAMADAPISANSMAVLARTGEEAVSAYNDLCQAKSLADALVSKTAAPAQTGADPFAGEH